MSSVRYRFLWPVVLITLCVVTLCAFTAISLFTQQADITQVLRENVSSRQAASDLRGCLNILVALEHNRVESVADLHARAEGLLRAIRRYADQPEEREFAQSLTAGFAEYLDRWKALPPPTDPGHEQAVAEATRFLEDRVLEPCREFEEYNDRRIEESTRHHENVLGQFAWGMAGVGALGAVAGLVFGFGVARGLNRSIRRLQVQIRDAAGKLGDDLPEIVLTGVGDFGELHDQVDRLTARIEEVVGQLQQRDREVLRAEQLAAVGQLAAGVAHEIRNPLTSIKMLVQAAQEDGAGGLNGEDLRVIEGEVRRQERSLQTFLDFARPSKLYRRPVEVVGVVRSVLGLVRGRLDKQRVEVRLDAPPGGLILIADPDQLQQVLVNLVLNALDALPSGGALTVAVRQRGGAAEVELSDTGPGIPHALLPRLFEPFVSGKETGLGLGLVISKRIVEDHGGSLAAVNRPGGGASFFIRIPTG
ncbi:MAG TPA: ATP-binding protein [Fimbriiglobus sp.]|nr:ATP-binding protein [Fimbriiglobus sp.]